MKYLEKTYKIPSNGVFDGPKEITLREMTTKEEKIMLGTKDLSVFERLVKSCTIDGDFDFNKVHSADIMYLTFMLRELTFGPEYSQEVICPHCGAKQEVIININEMKVKCLSEKEAKELKDGITLSLSTGDKISFGLISMGQSNNIDKIIKQRVQQNRLKDPISFEAMLRLAAAVKSIEPAESTDVDYTLDENKLQYLDELRLRDLNHIQAELGKIDFGIDRKIYRICERCDEQMEVTGYIVPEFFHPSM